uniref:protein-serine/threonine phosphatase n=1 Tax=Oryza brachyantha TaxID=4533 RepID=J3M5M0_ORYBR
MDSIRAYNRLILKNWPFLTGTGGSVLSSIYCLSKLYQKTSNFSSVVFTKFAFASKGSIQQELKCCYRLCWLSQKMSNTTKGLHTTKTLDSSAYYAQVIVCFILRDHLTASKNFSFPCASVQVVNCKATLSAFIISLRLKTSFRASCCEVHILGKPAQASDLYKANIGESCVVLASREATGMVAMQLIVVLNLDVPSEAERIKKCRGRVFALHDEPKVPRVWLSFDDALGLVMA